MGWQHHVHTAHVHHAAGGVENLQRWVNAFYRKLLSELRLQISDIKYLVPVAMSVMNSQRSQRYKVCPLTAMTGLVPRTPLKTALYTGTDVNTATAHEVNSKILKACSRELKESRRALDLLRRRLAVDKTEVRRQQRKRSRGRKTKTLTLEPGDRVLVALPRAGMQKHQLFWQGPYVVKEPYNTDSPIRYCPAAGINDCSLLYVVHPQGRPDETRVAHAERLRKFAAKDVDMPVEVIDSAQHDARQYQVDHIASHREDADGQLELEVFWMGFADPTWEPALVLKDDVPKLVLDYLKPLELQSAMAADIVSTIEAGAAADKEVRQQAALRARERKRASKSGRARKRKESKVATSAVGDGWVLEFLQENPKTPGSKSFQRYERYKGARSVAEFRGLGGTTADLRYDEKKGFLTVTGRS